MIRRKRKSVVSQRKTLVAKLDRLCSQVVRERDRYRCVTCGKTRAQGALIDAGHYVSRRCLKLRWDLRNVHAQCAYCNRFNAGAGAAYAAFILRTYGPGEVERLDRESREVWKPTLDELRGLLGHFQGKLDAATALNVAEFRTESDGGENLANRDSDVAGQSGERLSVDVGDYR